MQVFPINNINYQKKQSPKIRKNNNVSFRSNVNPILVEEAIKNAHKITTFIVDKKLYNIDDVNSSFKRIYDAYTAIPGITISPYIELLKKYNFISDVTGFLKIICKPIAEVPSELRDLVFMTEKDHLPLIEGEDIRKYPLIHMSNSGKYGFWNTIFNSEDSRNDIKIRILSGADYSARSWDIGLDKKGEVLTETETHFNISKSRYDGSKISSYKRRSVDSSIVPVWP